MASPEREGDTVTGKALESDTMNDESTRDAAFTFSQSMTQVETRPSTESEDEPPHGRSIGAAQVAAARRRKQSEPFPLRPVMSRRVSLIPWKTAVAEPGRKERAGSLAHVPWRLRSGPDHEEDSDDSSECDYVDWGKRSDARAQEQTEPNEQAEAAADLGLGRFRSILLKDEHCKSTAKVRKDGRLRITVHETAHTGYIAKALGAAAKRMAPTTPEPLGHTRKPRYDPVTDCQPHLNIVVMVVGSRGDVQPFLRIGKYMKEEFGHRVRIATHPVFRDLVEDSGLEFFSVGGDPAELMAFMVKNPGMIPTFETVKAGEIGRRRVAMAEMFDGFWKACVSPRDLGDGEYDENDIFIADSIVANPPSFAHIHCAEALGIPLHLIFTFPYTPTQAFPHPLASIKKSNVDQGYTNFISYPLVEMMTWQGLGDLVNNFRIKSLALDPVSTLWAPCATYRMRVPFTYLWSPGLVPKPEDWGEEIEVSGFVFLDLASAYKPPKELVDFLEAGEPPVYIGFGSIVVDDPEKFTDMIFEAVEKAGVRALVSKGWGGFGRDAVPDNIFMIDNVPHDWLFPRLKGCVHHGGAGTTAIGLKCGLPTMIVPFFGDQLFWGSMVGKSGAGPEPVPYSRLDSDKFADGLRYLLTPEAKEAAETIAARIAEDGDGARNALDSVRRAFIRFGPDTLRCSILKTHAAAWEVKGTEIHLSPVAAEVLVSNGQLSYKKLRLLRHSEFADFEGPGEPITAVAESVKNSIRDIFGGIGGAPYRIGKTAKRRIQGKIRSKEKKKRLAAENKDAAAAAAASANPTGNNEKPPAAKQRPRKQSLSYIPGPEQYATDIGRSVGQTALAIAKGPAALTLALAQGFHNAPRLYGDDTVRRPMRISGVRSGLIASGKEFTLGLYDGVTGVVYLPVRETKKHGARGFFRGSAMGLTGLVLKSISAVISPFAFTMQGCVRQVERHRSPEAFVRRARMAQGQKELHALDVPEFKCLQKEVLEGYDVMQQLRRAIADEEGKRGVAGQVDKVTLNTRFMFVGVDRAKNCLADLKSGKSIGEITALYKDYSVKTQDPWHAKRGTFNSSNRANTGEKLTTGEK